MPTIESEAAEIAQMRRNVALIARKYDELVAQAQHDERRAELLFLALDDEYTRLMKLLGRGKLVP